MNKGELIDKIAKDAKISKVQASNSLNSAIDGVVSTLRKGNKVTLVGFGTFSVSSRKARTGRNPQTGAPLKIPAKKVTKFVPGAGGVRGGAGTNFPQPPGSPRLGAQKVRSSDSIPQRRPAQGPSRRPRP